MAGKTPIEFRKDLDDLLRLAADLAVAEDRLERRAKQMREEEGWTSLVDTMTGGVHGAWDYALRAATLSDAERGLDVCQAIDDALAVVDLALSREDVAA